MNVLSGKGVYEAIATGKISVFKRLEMKVKRLHITDADCEKERVVLTSCLYLRDSF